MYALVPQVTLLVLVKLFLLSHSCVDCIISLSSLLLEENRVEVGNFFFFFLRLFFKYSLTFDLHISFIIDSYKRQFIVSPTFFILGELAQLWCLSQLWCLISQDKIYAYSTAERADVYFLIFEVTLYILSLSLDHVINISCYQPCI